MVSSAPSEALITSSIGDGIELGEGLGGVGAAAPVGDPGEVIAVVLDREPEVLGALVDVVLPAVGLRYREEHAGPGIEAIALVEGLDRGGELARCVGLRAGVEEGFTLIGRVGGRGGADEKERSRERETERNARVFTWRPP